MSAPTYISMIYKPADGTETPVWQKCAVTSQIVVTGQAISNVDTAGNPIDLVEPYEMELLDPTERAEPGQ